MSIQLSPRQVHLDFHTSEHIPDIAEEFDAALFAKTVKDAHISSMTVFARCHHGWLYYDSKRFPERVHPNLKNRNLLLEQVRALHAEGIRAPVYITVGWDYFTAARKSEWLIRKRDGTHEGGPFTEPGFYQTLCVNTGYYDFLKSQTEEVCRLLGDSLDGVFFDIVGLQPCHCAACREGMEKDGIDPSFDDDVRVYAKSTVEKFRKKMSALVRKHNKDCTIFYNAGHIGPCTRDGVDAYTHFELESLPSGSWGYQHFTVTARYARKLGKDCLGMTGKFHTQWGDFHSLKNQAALEFEVFRMLSFGFAASIGDQMEPRGVLNPATYRRIKKVYSLFEEREAWARPSVPVTEAALLTSESIIQEHVMGDDIMGAVQMLEELAIQFDILDNTMDLSPYKLVIIPESFRPSSSFGKKLNAYVSSGGAVIACGNAMLGKDDKFPRSFGVDYLGENEDYPDFIVARGDLAADLEPENEYVIYKQGTKIEMREGQAVLFSRSPYFPRKGDKFCSHRYTPSAGGEPYPAAVRNGNIVYFSHPLFSQYRDNAPMWCKTIISNTINMLLGHRLITHNGPSSLTVSLLEQAEKKRYTIHLLSYIPVRKSATIDIIEDRSVVRYLTLKLNLPKPIYKAVLAPGTPPESDPLEVLGRDSHQQPRELALGIDKSITIPLVDGYAIVELMYG